MKKTFFVISFLFFLFYCFFINFSSDSVFLYIPQKLFMRNWLLQGVIPLFNPHLFLGTPFLFDTNLGNLHPFSLLFLFPYPLSFALFVSGGLFMFMWGFFLFFRRFTANSFHALIGVMILVGTGNGLLRINNPAVFLVIAHYGFLLYYLFELKKKEISIPLILVGALMTVSGHIQFVIYGHILACIIGYFFYKVPLKRLVINNALIVLSMSWFYALAAPAILDSTRMTQNSGYLSIGNLAPQQLLTLVFPYLFGILKDGSLWNAGMKYEILSSVLLVPITLYLIWKKKMPLFMSIIGVISIISAMGYINLPFLRGASQIFIIIHILFTIVLVQNGNLLTSICSYFIKKRRIVMAIAALLFAAILFFFSPLWSQAGVKLLSLKRGAPNLFFDVQTIHAIGGLIGTSLFVWFVFFVFCLLGGYLSTKRRVEVVLILFFSFEGLLGFYLHNFFIPQFVISRSISIPENILNLRDYRIQSVLDVMPYTGFHTYLGNVLFRPPFSKEPVYIDDAEKKTFKKLENIFSCLPSNWMLIKGHNTVQGYNALVPARAATLFHDPSPDYEKEYAYIIARNPLFAQSEKGLDINVLETSRITMHDKRWGQVGVRYFISDSPLKSYPLLWKDSTRYIYENPNALPIYRVQKNAISPDFEIIHPEYSDPNTLKFQIGKKEVGKVLKVSINPRGFEAIQNGKILPIKKENISLSIPLNEPGLVTVYYSPLKHFSETVIEPIRARYEKILVK